MSQPGSPSNVGWRGVVSKESLGIVSIVLGIVLSAINIYLFFNGATKRELDNLKATIEQLSLQPSFDVTYYAVPSGNPLAGVLTGSSDLKDINHPLTQSRLLVDRRGKHFFLDDSGGPPLETVEPQASAGEPAYARAECSYYLVNFKYTGAVKLPAVDFVFETLSGGNGFLPTLDTLQNVGEAGEADVTSGLTRTETDVEVANVEKDDAFFVPLTLGCRTWDDQENPGIEFSFSKIGLPSKIKFRDPISGKDESTDVRKMLNNAIINSAGVLERG